VDARSVRSLRALLAVGGLLGLFGAASMLLFTLAAYGESTAAANISEGLPSWAVWAATPPGRVPMLLVGFLCALLLVAGRWPVKVFAALAAAWFVYAQVAFASGSRWTLQLEEGFNMTPFRVGGLVGVVALLALAVLALLMAARPTGRAQWLHGDAAQSPRS
jgi:lysylphosphatidylglycerol synthetase-like protein (DUF2156 family)